MKLQQRQIGSVTVIDIAGRLTAQDKGTLGEAIARPMDLGHKRIVLNVTDLEYLDSTTLGELVASQVRAIRDGMPLKLAGPGKRLTDLLLLTRLITVFETHETVAQAVESFNTVDK